MTNLLRILVALIVLSFAPASRADPAPIDPYGNWDDFRSEGPITPAERNAPRPSPDQPAASYRDAFCRVWNDDCTRCERDPRGSRIAQCAATTDGTCERKPVVCENHLTTAARVCLIYDDGCNLSLFGNGAATAVLCRRSQHGDRPRRGESCVVPRRPAYDEAHPHAKDDLAGHWWLVTPEGDTCFVTLNSIAGMWASTPCSPRLLSRLALRTAPHEAWNSDATCKYRAEKNRLTVTCRNELPNRRSKGADFVLTFSVDDIDRPIGIGKTKNWRLLRVSTLF